MFWEGPTEKLAIIIPCFNEELTISNVVEDCRKACPEALICVFDNNSTDSTAVRARKAGANVFFAPVQGKGAVMQQAFSEVDADYYVMIDGDSTYPAEEIPRLLNELKKNKWEMIVGTRLESYSSKAFRPSHFLGNQFFSKFVGLVFNTRVGDIFSGFRILTRDFVEGTSLTSRGFEIEADLTLQAVSQGLRVGECSVHYRDRPDGSFSKLGTFRDGFKILIFIFDVLKNYRPLLFFSFLAALSLLLSIVSGLGPIEDYIQYAYVYTLPRAILAASLMILSAVFLSAGIILDSLKRYNQQQLRLLQRINRRHNKNREFKKSA